MNQPFLTDVHIRVEPELKGLDKHKHANAGLLEDRISFKLYRGKKFRTHRTDWTRDSYFIIIS